MEMYTVSVRRRFTSQLLLTHIQPDEDAIATRHDFIIEATVEGNATDKNGYLIDTGMFEAALDDLIRKWDAMELNSLPEFETANPTMENIARVAAKDLASYKFYEQVDGLRVQVWQSEQEVFPGPSATYYMKISTE